MQILISVLAFLIIFSLLIFVHELGHFTAAKRGGIEVQEFGFGMPPRIWGKKVGETIYSINWIPFGGFVKMLGEDPTDPKAKKSKKSFSNRPLRTRMAVAIAGVVMNLLLAFFCLTVGFWIGIEPLIVTSEDFMDAIRDGQVLIGQEKLDEKDETEGLGWVVALPRVAVYEVDEGSIGDEIGFQKGDVILKVNDEEVFELSDYERLSAYGVDQYEVWRNEEVIRLDGEFDYAQSAVISYVIEGSSAEEAGLQIGDLVLELQGEEIYYANDVLEMTSSSDEDVLEYVVERDGEIIEYDIPRGEDGYVGIYVGDIDYGDDFGLALYDTSLNAVVYSIEPVRYGLVQAPVEAGREMVRLSVLTGGMIKDLAFDLVSSGEVPEGVAGPVGIAQMTHVFVQEGFASTIRFIALLSLSLAVFNIIPFPALDGGRLAFLLYEAATGRKPNPRFETALHGLGFMLLMLLLLFVTFQDVARLFN